MMKVKKKLTNGSEVDGHRRSSRTELQGSEGGLRRGGKRVGVGLGGRATRGQERI